MAKQLNINLAFTADATQAKKEIKDLQQALNKISTEGNGAGTLAPDIQAAAQAAADLSAKLRSATNVDTGKLNLNQFNASLKASGRTLESYARDLKALGPAGSSAFMQLTKQIVAAEAPIVNINGRLKEMAVSLRNTARWQLSSSLLHGFMGTIQSAYGYAQDLDKSLNNIRIVTGQTTEQMAQFAKAANNAAKELSTTTTNYTDAALIYYQQGLSDKQVKERTEATIKMANVAHESATQVSSYMTAIWNNFNKAGDQSAEHFGDVLTKLGATTAASTKELAGGLEKFASVADTIGLSYDYASAALATIIDKTRQSEDIVGTALKTIFARIQGLNLGKTLDDGTSLNKYSNALKTVGVDIKDASGEIKGMDQILDDLGSKWNNLSQDTKMATAQTVAGVRQYTQLIALMDNWDAFKSNVNTARTADGELQNQQDIYAQGWEAARDRVKAAAEDIFDSLVDNKGFIALSDGLKHVLDTIATVIDGLGGMKGALLLIGTIATKVFHTQIAAGLKSTVQGIKNLVPGYAARTAAAQQQQALDTAKSVFDFGAGRSGRASQAAFDQEQAMQSAMLRNQANLTDAQLNAAKGRQEIIHSMQQQTLELSKQIDLEREKTEALEEQKRLAEVQAKTSQRYRENKSKAKAKYKAEINAEIAAREEAEKQASKKKKLSSDKRQEIRSEVEQEVLKRNGVTREQASQQIMDETRNLQNDYRAINEKIGTLSGISSNLGQIGQKMEENASSVNVFKNSLLDAENLTKQYSQTLEGSLSQEAQNAIKTITQLAQKVREGGDNYEMAAEDVKKLTEAMTILQSDAGNTAQYIPNIDAQGDHEVAKGVQENAARKVNANLAEDRTDRTVNNNNDLLDKQALDNLTSWQSKLTAVSQSIMSLGLVISSVQGIIDVFNDPDASGWDKFVAVMTGLVTVIPTVISLFTSLASAGLLGGAGLEVMGAGATGAAVGLGTLWAAAWPLLAVLAGLAAAFIVVKTVVDKIKWNSEAAQIERAKQKAEDLKQAYEDIKSANESIAEGFNQYDSVVSALNDCTEGTKDWEDALQQVNDQVTSLLRDYPELAKFIKRDPTTGQLVIDTEAANNYLSSRELIAKGIEVLADNATRKEKTDDSMTDAVDTALMNLPSSRYLIKPLQDENGYVTVNPYFYEQLIDQIIRDNVDSLSQATTDEEFFNIIKNAFSGTDNQQSITNHMIEDQGNDPRNFFASNNFDDYFGDYIIQNSYVPYAQDIMNLLNSQFKTLENNTLANNASLESFITDVLKNNSAISNSGYLTTVSRFLTNQDLFNGLDEKKSDLSANIDKWDNADAYEVATLWSKYVELGGSNKDLKNDAIQEKEGVLKFALDDDTFIPVDTVADFVAMNEVIEEITQSAIDLVSTLNNLDASGNLADQAIKHYITDGNFDNASQEELNALQSEEGQFRLNNFITSEEAEKFGISELAIGDALIRAQQAFENIDFSESWGNINGVDKLSVNLQNKLQKTLKKISLGPDGEEAAKTFVETFNQVITDELDSDTQKKALSTLTSIDWSDWDAADQARESLTKLGIAVDSIKWDTFATDMRKATGAVPDFSKLKSELSTIQGILNSLDFGSTIKADDYEKLKALGPLYSDLANSFMLLADGSYRFQGNIKEIQKISLNRIKDQRAIAATQKKQQDDLFGTGSSLNGVDWTNEARKTGLDNQEYKVSAKNRLADIIDQNFNESGAKNAVGQALTDMGYTKEILDQILNETNSEDFEHLIELFTRLGNLKALDFSGISADFDSMAASLMTNIVDLNDLLDQSSAEGNTFDETAYKNQVSYLAQNAKSLAELSKIQAEVRNNALTIEDYQQGLLNIASQYENATKYAKAYEAALSSGKQTLIDSTQLELKNQLQLEETATARGLDSDEVREYVKSLKETEKYKDFDVSALTTMAIGFLSLNDVITDTISKLQDLYSTISQLDYGKTVTEEQIKQIRELAKGWEDFFVYQSNGTYKFIGTQEQAAKITEQLVIEQTKAYVNSKNRIAEWTAANDQNQWTAVSTGAWNDASMAQAANLQYSAYNDTATAEALKFLNPLYTSDYIASQIGTIQNEDATESEKAAAEAILQTIFGQLASLFDYSFDQMDQNIEQARASSVKDIDQLNKMHSTSILDDNGSVIAGPISNQTYITQAQSMLDSSTSMSELTDILNNIQVPNAFYDLSQGLLNIAEQFENASSEAATFKEIMELGNQAQLEAAGAALELANWCGELAKNYSLDAEELENYAKQMKDSEDYSETTTQELVELAKEQARFDRAVSNASKNLATWKKALSETSKTGMVASSTLTDLSEAYGDLLDMDPEQFSTGFLKNANNLKLMEDYLNGDVEAYKKLQDAAREDIETKFNLDSSALYNGLDSILSKAQDIANDNTIEVGAAIEDADFVNALNEMVNAAGMTADQVTTYLSSMGLNADVTTETEEIEQPKRFVGATATVSWEGGKGTNPITGEEQDYLFPSVTYSPAPAEDVDISSAMGIGMEVTAGGGGTGTKSSGGKVNISNVRKAAGGGGKAGNSSNFGKGGNGGGGGGSKKPAKKQKITPKKDIVNRYKEIDDRIDDLTNALDKANKQADRLFGKGRIDMMNRETKVLQAQAAAYKQKLAEAKEYLKIDFQALSQAASDAGAQFTIDEHGNLTNYTQEMSRLYEEYNKLEQQWANPNNWASEEDQNTFNEEQVKPVKERLDALKEAISQYDETKELMEDFNNQWQDIQNQIQDKNYEKITYKLEYEIQLDDGELKVLDYYTDKLSDDFYSMAEALGYMMQKMPVNLDKLDEYENAFNKLEAAYKAGEISQANFVEGIQNMRDNLIDTLKAVEDLDKATQEYYQKTLEAGDEQLSKYVDRLETTNDTLSHYKDLIVLINGEYDYKNIAKVLNGNIQIRKQQLEVAKANYERNVSDKEYWENYIANVKEGSEEYKFAEERIREANQRVQESENEVLEKTQEYVQSAKDLLENDLADAARNLELIFTNGLGFDALNDSMERVSKYQDEYLTKTNQLYETQKLMNKAQRDADKTNNEAAKLRIASYIAETEELQNKTKLSNFELKVQQAKYNLLLAQIALEEAQNAKSTVRLSRDNEGNFGYVYTADQKKIGEAEDGVLDAENDLYQIALDGINNNAQKFIQTRQEMLEKLNEVQENWKNGQYASEEEYNETIMRIREEYEPLLESYLEQWRMANDLNANASRDAWMNAYMDEINATGDWKADIDTYLQEAAAAFEEYQGSVDIANTAVNEVLGDTETAVKDVLTASQKLTDFILKKDGLIDGINKETEAVRGQIAEYEKLRNAILEAIQKKEELLNRANALAESEAANSAPELTSDDNIQQLLGTTQTTILPAVIPQATTPSSGGGGGNSGGGNGGGNGGSGNKGTSDDRYYADEQERAIAEAEAAHKIKKGAHKAKKAVQPAPSSSWAHYVRTKQNQILGLDTGGYTGVWGPEGKLAALHEKEIVLNKEDTSNLLASVSLIRDITKTIDFDAARASSTSRLVATGLGVNGSSGTLEQSVHIEANFPNATDRNEIQEAFNTLINVASQYANRKTV